MPAAQPLCAVSEIPALSTMARSSFPCISKGETDSGCAGHGAEFWRYMGTRFIAQTANADAAYSKNAGDTSAPMTSLQQPCSPGARNYLKPSIQNARDGPDNLP